MKRIIASAGLVTLGALSLQAAYAPGLTPQEQMKPWSVGISLRGFYDDNINSTPSNQKEESFGFAVTPYLSLNKVMDQTLITFNYTYNMRWYEARQDEPFDQTHYVKLGVSHAFSESMKLDVKEKFVYTKDPTVVQEAGAAATTTRSDQGYANNVASVGLDATFSERFGAEISYQNQYWDYSDEGNGSYSAMLDRWEHLPQLRAKWFSDPSTFWSLGAQYQIVDYKSKDLLSNGQSPSDRDRTSLTPFLGVSHEFNPTLSGNLDVGASFTETDQPNSDSEISPYFAGKLAWSYNPGCSLTLGVIHAINSTDISADYQESTIGYLSLTHRITPRLTGTAMGQFQYSEAVGGIEDGEVDMIYAANVNLNYAFNHYLSCDLGYSFDRDDSDLAYRTYSRNRVYLGLRATY